MNWINLALLFAAGVYIGHLHGQRRKLRRLIEITEGERDRLAHIVSWTRDWMKTLEEQRDAARMLRDECHQMARSAEAAIDFALDRTDCVATPAEGEQFLQAWRDGEWGVIANDWPEFDLTTAGLTLETIANLKEQS